MVNLFLDGEKLTLPELGLGNGEKFTLLGV